MSLVQALRGLLAVTSQPSSASFPSLGQAPTCAQFLFCSQLTYPTTQIPNFYGSLAQALVRVGSKGAKNWVNWRLGLVQAHTHQNNPVKGHSLKGHCLVQAQQAARGWLAPTHFVQSPSGGAPICLCQG